jgi:hypothetical protein
MVNEMEEHVVKDKSFGFAISTGLNYFIRHIN